MTGFKLYTDKKSTSERRRPVVKEAVTLCPVCSFLYYGWEDRMRVPERTEAQDDRACRIYYGEPEECIDCVHADHCEACGGDECYRAMAEEARQEAQLDEMRERAAYSGGRRNEP